MTSDVHQQILEWFNGQATVKLLGARGDELDEGRARLVFEPGDELRNPNGGINGGVLSAYADLSGGLAVASVTGLEAASATIELGIHFMRAARATPLIATARVLRHGRQIAFVTIEVLDAEGGQVLGATGTWAIGRGSRIPGGGAGGGDAPAAQ